MRSALRRRLSTSKKKKGKKAHKHTHTHTHKQTLSRTHPSTHTHTHTHTPEHRLQKEAIHIQEEKGKFETKGKEEGEKSDDFGGGFIFFFVVSFFCGFPTFLVSTIRLEFYLLIL